MLGYIIYGDGPKKPELGQYPLAGVSFTSLRFGEARRPNGPLALRRAARGAEQLREAGARRAVFPVDFPYTALFIRRGIAPVETLPLRRALAGPLTRRRMEELGLSPTQAVVALSADRMTREVADTARSLALSFRYVLLSVPSGGEEFARSLRREYGVSLLLDPSPDQLDRADALLLYAPRGELSGENRVFYALYPGGEAGRGRLPLCLPAGVAERVEPNCCGEQLAAALYALGAVSLETLLAEIPC